MPMLTYPAGLEVYILIFIYIFIQTLCMCAAKSLVSLHISTGSPEPLLLDNVITGAHPGFLDSGFKFAKGGLDLSTLPDFSYRFS